MMKNSFQELTNRSAKKFLNDLHQQYLNRIQFYGIKDNDLNRFSWTGNKKFNLYVIQVYSDSVFSLSEHTLELIFATPFIGENNRLFFVDLKKETTNINFVKQGKMVPSLQLSWLKEKGLIPSNLQGDIINESLNLLPGPLSTLLKNYDNEHITKKWVDNEYDKTLEKESQPTPLAPFPTSNQHYFIDRYHFDEMLDSINQNNEGEQFTDEFNQCLFAYEHEKWFICAAGLGSCIEHLMLIIILNYANKGYKKLLNSLGKDPTAKDYIAAFRKEPINISTRQERFFNSVFGLRNSIDHHNTGKTQRSSCDLLLDQISDIYNDYYKKSITINPKSSQSKKK